MRRIASLRLMLTLSTLALGGCGGYNTWSALPFTTGNNPNQPVTDSENMRRVMGQPVEVGSLGPEPGDIWPGPLPPSPTLQDLEQGGLTSQPEQPVPGSPQSRNPQASAPQSNPQATRQAPQPARGSSTPPGSTQPSLSSTPAPTVGTPSATVQPAPRNPAGQSYQTPRGSEVTTGGGTNYQTTVSPGGGSSIVVPNGNGTSTIIHSDGRIETVTTPK
jgi:hypothetical protein